MFMDKSSLLFKWLWIVAGFGTGNKRIWDIVNLHDSVDIAFDLLYNKSTRNQFHLVKKEIDSIEAVSDNMIFEIISYCNSYNIGIVTYSDELYPELLRDIYNPPAVLFYKGDFSCIFRDLTLAVVGTRKPSVYSEKVTAALIRQLSDYNLTVISGFAVGIDIVSHLAAVRNGGKTAVILGCGIDYNYPADNVKYREEILANGVFISEFFPKTKAASYNFPLRNRILSGLALGTIVIEAGKKSGSLITANLALQQGRDIFAVPPHNLFDERYLGNVELLRDGAIAIFGLQDVLYEYYENYSHKLTHIKPVISEPPPITSITPAAPITSSSVIFNDVALPFPQVTEIVADNTALNAFLENALESKRNDISTASSEIDLSSFSDDEMAVINILRKNAKAMLADEISVGLNLGISDVLCILTDLEISGVIESAAGNSFMLV